MGERHVIWSDIDLDIDNFEDFLEEEHPDVTDEYEKYALCQELNDDYLGDERMNMDRDVGGRIVIIATLGLWYGRRSAYKVLDGHNLADVLEADSCDYHEWFVEDGELQCKAIHHDGTNLYTYRALLPNIGDDLYYDIVYGEASNEQILKGTRSLAPDVCEVYGWTA